MENIGNNHIISNIIKGVLISFLFTIISLTIFAILLVYTNLSEGIIQPVIITLTGISILLGSSIITRKIKKNGMFNGAIIGISYILTIYIISSLLSSNFTITISSAIMILVGLICGILGRNNRSKCIKYENFGNIILKNSYLKMAVFIVLVRNLKQRCK